MFASIIQKSTKKTMEQKKFKREMPHLKFKEYKIKHCLTSPPDRGIYL